MTSATNLARYIIYLIKKQMKNIQPEEFDVTPLKIQKLLYYCQGYALALTGEKLFDEPIEAWKYGPVVDAVYQEYKKYNGQIIPEIQSINFNEIDDTARSIVKMVIEEKNRFSGTALADATHRETPYVSCYKGAYINAIIPEEVLKDFFSQQFLKREEPEDDEDEFWMSAGKTVSLETLEAVLEKI